MDGGVGSSVDSSVRGPTAPGGPAAGSDRRGGWWARTRRRVPPLVWVFLLVPLAVELYWVFWPALNSFSLSFTSWRGVGLAQPVGLANYERMLDDPIFRTALVNNVIWVVGFGGLSVVGGLGLAVALNKPGRGIGLYRSAIGR